MITERLEYTAHDTVAAGMYLYAGLVAVGLGGIADRIGVDGAVFQLYAVGDALHVLLGYILVRPYVIYLFLHIFRMGELGGEVAVVGEQKHTGGIAVKASHGIDALVARALHEVKHGSAPIGIVGSRDTVLRLVEQDVALALQSHDLLIVFHLVCVGDLCAEFGYYLAVDLYQTLLDEFVGLAARADAGIGHELVQADLFFRIQFGHLILYAFGTGNEALALTHVVFLETTSLHAGTVIVATLIAVVTAGTVAIRTLLAVTALLTLIVVAALLTIVVVGTLLAVAALLTLIVVAGLTITALIVAVVVAALLTVIVVGTLLTVTALLTLVVVTFVVAALLTIVVVGALLAVVVARLISSLLRLLCSCVFSALCRCGCCRCGRRSGVSYSLRSLGTGLRRIGALLVIATGATVISALLTLIVVTGLTVATLLTIVVVGALLAIGTLLTRLPVIVAGLIAALLARLVSSLRTLCTVAAMLSIVEILILVMIVGCMSSVVTKPDRLSNAGTFRFFSFVSFHVE